MPPPLAPCDKQSGAHMLLPLPVSVPGVMAASEETLRETPAASAVLEPEYICDERAQINKQIHKLNKVI